MHALVTGVGGFAGQYLARLLLGQGHTLHGIWRGGRLTDGLRSLVRQFPSRIKSDSFLAVDIREADRVSETVLRAKPDVIFHLAAVTFAPQAEARHEEVLLTNVGGTLNVLRAAREIRCRVVLISSAEVYGAGSAGSPVLEDAPLAPVTVYGISKAAAEMAAAYAHWNFGQDVIIVRPFNHTGPGQSRRFVCSAFASQLAEIEAGIREPVVRVGNLDAVRDFSDVRDVVRGYVRLAETGEAPQAYNLCSHRGVRVGSILDELIRLTGLAVAVLPSSERLRGREVGYLVGSFEKARARCGWMPEVELEATLKELLGWWRDRVGQESN